MNFFLCILMEKEINLVIFTNEKCRDSTLLLFLRLLSSQDVLAVVIV